MGRLTPLEEMIKIKKFLSFTKNWLLDVIPDFIDFVKIAHGNIKNIHTGKGSVVFYSILFISIPSTFYFIYLSIIIFFSTINSLTWEATEGILKQKEPVLIYTYKVDGKEYESNIFDQISIIREQSSLRNNPEEYNENQSLKVYYNPKNYQESVISRKLDVNVSGLILFISLGTMLGSIPYRKKPLKFFIFTTIYSLVFMTISVILSLVV